MVACVTDGKTGGNTVTDSDTIVVDTINNTSKVVVGTVGEGTTMHMLELVTDDDSLYYFDYENNVIGGLVAGDVVNVLYEETDGDFGGCCTRGDGVRLYQENRNDRGVIWA